MVTCTHVKCHKNIKTFNDLGKMMHFLPSKIHTVREEIFPLISFGIMPTEETVEQWDDISANNIVATLTDIILALDNSCKKKSLNEFEAYIIANLLGESDLYELGQRLVTLILQANIQNYNLLLLLTNKSELLTDIKNDLLASGINVPLLVNGGIVDTPFDAKVIISQLEYPLTTSNYKLLAVAFLHEKVLWEKSLSTYPSSVQHKLIKLFNNSIVDYNLLTQDEKDIIKEARNLEKTLS